MQTVILTMDMITVMNRLLREPLMLQPYFAVNTVERGRDSVFFS
jgi:hypothetical protein